MESSCIIRIYNLYRTNLVAIPYCTFVGERTSLSSTLFSSLPPWKSAMQFAERSKTSLVDLSRDRPRAPFLNLFSEFTCTLITARLEGGRNNRWPVRIQLRIQPGEWKGRDLATSLSPLLSLFLACVLTCTHTRFENGGGGWKEREREREKDRGRLYLGGGTLLA